MEQKKFAPPTIEIARQQARKLIYTLQEATGFPDTFIAKVARGEPKWWAKLDEIGMTFGSFDMMVSRLSAVWPDDVAWPEDVPRQAPAEIGPEGANPKDLARETLPYEMAADFRQRLEKLREQKREREAHLTGG